MFGFHCRSRPKVTPALGAPEPTLRPTGRLDASTHPITEDTMTKQGWTATVSTALFVVLIAIVSLVPVPFVSWAPGSVTNLLGEHDGARIVQVSGAPTYPSTGQIQLTTVSVTRVDASMTLPQAFLAYVLPAQLVLPREVVYPIGRPNTQQQAEEVEQMTSSQRDAVVAALVAAGQEVTPRPVVSQVSSSGPAYGKVQAGDLIATLNGSAVASRGQVNELLSQLEVGTVVRLGLIRGAEEFEVAVTTVAAQDNPNSARMGIDLENSYQHPVRVEFALNQDLVGQSGGLAFALTIYDELTPGDLINGRIVAATGEISASGEVGSVGALRQKLRAAERAGAEVMLVPASNCVDVTGFGTSLDVVAVTTLTDAVASLQLLTDPQTAGQVPRC